MWTPPPSSAHVGRFYKGTDQSVRFVGTPISLLGPSPRWDLLRYATLLGPLWGSAGALWGSSWAPPPPPTRRLAPVLATPLPLRPRSLTGDPSHRPPPTPTPFLTPWTAPTWIHFSPLDGPNLDPFLTPWTAPTWPKIVPIWPPAPPSPHSQLYVWVIFPPGRNLTA